MKEKMEEIDLGGGSKLYYKRKLIEEDECKDMYKKLLDEIEWEKREVKLYGKTFQQPRLISYMLVIVN